MYSKYHLIKVFGSFFWNYELLFLDQANSSSYPSEILIIQFPMIQTFLQHNTHHVLHRFRYFVLPQASTRRHKYWIYQTICQAKPIKFIIKLCTDHYNLWDNTLPIKNCVCKSCSLSKLDSTVNNNSIFNTKYADFSAKW